MTSSLASSDVRRCEEGGVTAIPFTQDPGPISREVTHWDRTHVPATGT